jgi:hypothetical protein
LREPSQPAAELVPLEDVWFKELDIVVGRVVWANERGARVVLERDERFVGCEAVRARGRAVLWRGGVFLGRAGALNGISRRQPRDGRTVQRQRGVRARDWRPHSLGGACLGGLALSC